MTLSSTAAVGGQAERSLHYLQSLSWAAMPEAVISERI
jgi:hypothetical protein